MEYVPAEHQNALYNRYRMAMMIVMAFGVSVLIWLLAAKFVAPREAPPGSEEWGQPIYSAVIVIGLSVVALRRIMLSKMVMGAAATRGVQSVLKTLQTMTIVCCALAELAALGGFVLYLLTGNYDYSWRLGVIGLFLVIYSFPRRSEWERAVADSAKTSSQPRAAKPI